MTRINLLITLLVTMFAVSNAAAAYTIRKAMKSSGPNFDESDMFQKYVLGNMGVYLDPVAFNSLMKQILNDFPEVVKKVQVGNTYNGVDMQGYLIGLGLNNTNWKTALLSRPAILIDSMHHTRELSTMSMTVYTMIKLLFQYVHNDFETIYQLRNTAIYVIPVVNWDGYLKSSEIYSKTKSFSYMRKNRHAYPSQSRCGDDNIGVDLNRNYGFKFGYDEFGSTGESDPCQDDYRGPDAFSEPETANIRDFVDRWTNIKIAINLHSYSNVFLTPMRYDASNTEL